MEVFSSSPKTLLTVFCFFYFPQNDASVSSWLGADRQQHFSAQLRSDALNNPTTSGSAMRGLSYRLPSCHTLIRSLDSVTQLKQQLQSKSTTEEPNRFKNRLTLWWNLNKGPENVCLDSGGEPKFHIQIEKNFKITKKIPNTVILLYDDLNLLTKFGPHLVIGPNVQVGSRLLDQMGTFYLICTAQTRGWRNKDRGEIEQERNW